MKTNNTEKQANFLQSFIDCGKITFITNTLIYHGNTGLYVAGNIENIDECYHVIVAYMKAGK